MPPEETEHGAEDKTPEGAEELTKEEIEARTKAEIAKIKNLTEMITVLGETIDSKLREVDQGVPVDMGKLREDLELKERLEEERRKIEEGGESKLFDGTEIGYEPEIEEETPIYGGTASSCPLCNNTVSSSSSRCKKCGGSFVVNEFKCGHCGADVDAFAVLCPKCDGGLISEETGCPVCGATVDAFDERCYACGAEFAKNEFRCAKCGASTKVDALTCRSCGTVFREAEPWELEEKEEKEAAESEKKKKTPIERASRDTKTRRVLFPFAAVVGQENMKLALILNAIDPEIGGVLAQGQKGTAKSVTVRGVTEILPPIDVIDGCRFSCDPATPEKWCWECRERFPDKTKVKIITRPIRVVDLPLNATEDRVVGSIDVEKILKEGLRAFEHGILADANRGILYVDEINLLDDNVVDILLDAAAMGLATVEREAVSVSYPAKFIIVGTMNPEEGGLRPQLIDRIALNVPIRGLQNVQDRIEVVRRRDDFTRDPDGFRKHWEGEMQKLRERIVRARELIQKVQTPEKLIELITRISLYFGVDGHRCDLIMERTARAIAAWEGRTVVTVEDVIRAGEFALPHRMRKRPFEEEEFSADRLRRVVEELSAT